MGRGGGASQPLQRHESNIQECFCSSNLHESKTLPPFITDEIFYDNLGLISTKSFTLAKDIRKSCNFDVDFAFGYQLFEDEVNEVQLQSSEMVGSISNYQSPQLIKLHLKLHLCKILNVQHWSMDLHLICLRD